MGRILAIDYGQKRVGLAVTDPMQMIANALDTIPVHEIFTYLENYLRHELVDKFVVGLPKQMNGEDSDSKKYIDEFVTGLKRKFPDKEVVFFDERFTSVMAQRTILESGIGKKARQNKALVDKIAAVIILQGFMETRF